MIPRQSRKISFYEEYVQTISVEFHKWMLIINYTLVLVIFVIFFSFDYKADAILKEQNNLKNNTDLYGKYGYDSLGACIGIPLSFPYLKDQIVGPDHQIISCDHIEVLDSWLNDWCTFYKLPILSKRVYRILKLWTTYQYQYRKGLFLTWLEKRKEKSMQQNDKSVKEVTTNDIKIVTVE
ncbi:10103_t:CDS:2 [Dentiscutata erythropus]|uniref:10103_t:CDS:1 n=1 Tax=Dentiscutata erythropus TaxID=1348616 RepID=A0A9N9HWK1_9GLOM|nr:10103_t:CDS:2 [Dentiscutata erythropus]